MKSIVAYIVAIFISGTAFSALEISEIGVRLAVGGSAPSQDTYPQCRGVANVNNCISAINHQSVEATVQKVLNQEKQEEAR